MRIINLNHTDTATLTAFPTVLSSLPVTNLTDVARAKVMRSDPLTGGGGDTTQEIKLTWTASKGFSTCALVRHNLSSTAQWQVEIYTTDDWTGDTVYDSGLVDVMEGIPFGELEFGVDPFGKSIFTDWDSSFTVIWFTKVVGQSVKITLHDNNTDNPDDYMEASRLFIGTYLEPTYTASFGMDMGWTESTKQDRSSGGTLRSDAGVPYRKLNFNLNYMPEAERHYYLELFRKIGMRTDVFISLYPGVGGVKERDHSIHAKFVSMSQFNHNHYNGYIVPFKLEEA